MPARGAREDRGRGLEERDGARQAARDPGGDPRSHGQGEGSDPRREVADIGRQRYSRTRERETGGSCRLRAGCAHAASPARLIRSPAGCAQGSLYALPMDGLRWERRKGSARSAPGVDCAPSRMPRGTSRGELRLERRYRGDAHRGLPLTVPKTEEASMAEGYDFYIGLDWGTARHQVCVLDAAGRRVAEQTIAHSGAGVAAWLAELARYAPTERLAVALEVPRGAVVDALLAHGCHVYALNPKQLDRFRDRQTVAGAKDDRRDAGVLADALRTDRGAFRALQPDDPRLGPLRELTRLARELGTESTRLTNRLREQLVRSLPQVLTLCPAADEPWLWTLLERASTAP